MPAIKILVAGEHVHRAALAPGIAAAAPGQFRHHAFGVHAASQHVAVIAIAGDHLVTVKLGHLHADDDRFLADIKVAEAADQAHAVHLAGLLLEAADRQHLAQRLELLLLAEFRDLAVMHAPIDGGAKLVSAFFGWLGFGDGHSCPRDTGLASPIAEIARLRKRSACVAGWAEPAKALPAKIILGIAASTSRLWGGDCR